MKKKLFFSSQDYGCFIQPDCADTTFAPGTFEYDYLGISKIGPQDMGPVNRPIQIVPQTYQQSDNITDGIIKYNNDSSTTLWHYPKFEQGFSAYPDYLSKTASASAVFTDATPAHNIYGILNRGATFSSLFLALDAASLQYRSDTSLHTADYSSITDPKYRWIGDVKHIADYFIAPIAEIEERKGELPQTFSLVQNFPNPFNPSTTINYEVASRGHVSINIYNMLGQTVGILVNEVKEPGRYTASFNGRALSSGLYFYEMRAGSFVSVKKMMLLK